MLQQRYPGILQWYNNIHKLNAHKCENCGRTNGKINAHHILAKAAFPQFATHPKNWILLCRTCHKLIHRTSRMQEATIIKKQQIRLLCQKKIKNTELYSIYKISLGVKTVSKQPKKQKPIYNNITFDSNQEIFFYKWCQQAVKYKIMDSFTYHPDSYTLSQAKFYNTKKILHPHIYTPDYIIKLTQLGRNILQKVFKVFFNDNLCMIEIKPAYSPYGSIEEFSINRKWMYEKYNIFVEKIEVDSLFIKTWCPQNCKLTQKTKKIRDKYKYCDTISTFIERGKENEKFKMQKTKKIRKTV